MRVKVCGITNLEDARLALQCGAWALGFVFYPSSPRYIDPGKAGEILRQLPEGTFSAGVLVNPSLEAAFEALSCSGVSALQLHGDETPDLCAKLPVPVIKGVRLSSQEDLEALCAYSMVQYLLADAAAPGQWGGTGRLSDWELAGKAGKHGRLILSGGLNAGNIRAAIETVRPYAVDLSSGLEERPGKKAPEKLRAFFSAVNAIGQEGEE